MHAIRVLNLVVFLFFVLNGSAQEDSKYEQETRNLFKSNKIKGRKITRIGQDGTAPFSLIEQFDDQGRTVCSYIHNAAYDRLTRVDSSIYKKGFLSKRIFFGNDFSDSIIFHRDSYDRLRKEIHFKNGSVTQERSFFYRDEKVVKEVILYNSEKENPSTVGNFNHKDSISYQYLGDTIVSEYLPSGEINKYIVKYNRSGYIQSVLDFCDVRKDPCRKKYYEYDKKNKLLRKKEFDDSNMLFRYVYYYDRLGLCVKEEIYSPGMDSAIATILYEYTY